MTNEQRLKNLEVPSGKIDVVLDTDAFNEIDDQFAIAYLLKNKQKLNTVALYAAPFLNDKSVSAEDGMLKSYDEINRLLRLMGEKVDVFKGSDRFLSGEDTPVIFPAAEDLAMRAKNYSPENPLYVVAIGAITDIASAILLNPQVAENCVVVLLGGHAPYLNNSNEFNMKQDIAAARIVFGSGVPLIHLPALGVVCSFSISGDELEHWLVGKNPLADYLAKSAIKEAERCGQTGANWTRVIWDVTAIGWLLNDDNRFMHHFITPVQLPTYDFTYEPPKDGTALRYVYHIERNRLMNDLIKKLTEN